MTGVITISAWDGRVIWTGPASSIADAVRQARASRADLTRADLTRADLRGADLRGADLTRADLRDADLTCADLTCAVLRGADLRGADLTRADLRDADLTCADLTCADLRGAVLRGAAWRTSPLHMLHDQPGAIRAYKLVTAEYRSPMSGPVLTYAVGQSYAVDDADTNPSELCGAGLHVASMDWILREWQPGQRVLLVEFTAADIACIPLATDGKWRLHRLTVVGEVDLVARGLVDAPDAEVTP